MHFFLDADEVVHTRGVYNCLDFIGDNGGLFDGLSVIVEFFMSIAGIFKSNQTLIYLVSKVFKTDYKK